MGEARRLIKNTGIIAVGGMATKLKAAKLAAQVGCDMIITNGQYPERLYDIAEGKPVGTRFLGKKSDRDLV